jgi:hypothetical protein
MHGSLPTTEKHQRRQQALMTRPAAQTILHLRDKNSDSRWISNAGIIKRGRKIDLLPRDS